MNSIIAFGHRGARGHEPENTLLSFRTAVSMGVDGIELDVYKTADGHVIVNHSDSLELEGRRYRISKMTLEQAKSIVLEKDQRVPTLDEVFKEMESLKPGILYSIDLKDVRDLEDYYKVLEKHGVIERVYTCSESRLLLKKIHRQHPDLALVYSTHVNDDGVVGDLEKVDPSMVKVINLPVGELLGLESDQATALVSEIHEKGLLCFAWDANTRQEVERAVELGVDGLYSDYPDMLVEVLGK